MPKIFNGKNLVVNALKKFHVIENSTSFTTSVKNSQL